MTLAVSAPLAGVVVALDDVPDAVFAEGVVGPGLAVLPDVRSGLTAVLAPVTGVLAAVHPHAFLLQVDARRSVLVHLGVDTVTLRGEGFTVHRVVGDRLTVGDPVVSWDVAQVAACGLSVVCPVVAVQAAAEQVAAQVAPGTRVDAGDPLLSWSSPGA